MQEDFYILLLYKQLDGEISREEKRQLNEWRKRSPENEREAKSVELAWKATAPRKASIEVDTDKEFALLTQRIENEPSARVVKMPTSTKQRRPWLAIAASVAVLVLVTTYFFQNNNTAPLVEWVEVVTEDRARTIVLTDQTEVHLNKNSKLRYPVVFQENERRITLEGEAFFEVSHRADHPFIVATQQEEVRVLGTSFNVSTFEGITHLFVATGKVQFSSLLSEQKMILLPNQAANIEQHTGTLSVDELASNNAISWFTKKHTFQKTELQDILTQIEKEFNIHFSFDNKQLAHCLLDTTFDANDINGFIEVINIVLGAEVEEVNQQEFIIKGGSCQ